MATRPVRRPFLTCRELETRYARLLWAMQWVACLSHGEARACLRDYRDGFPFSGEAVNHFGGTVAVLRAASRASVRSIAADHLRYAHQKGA